MRRRGDQTTQQALRGAPRIRSVPLGVVVAVVVLLTIGAPASATAEAGGAGESPDSEPDDEPTTGPDGGVPGTGAVVRVARPTWDTGWFQAEILARLLGDLGYAVEGPRTMDNADFYAGLAEGTVDVWLSGWFPLHQPLVDEFAPDDAVPVGFEVRGGALQGYVVDRATAERLDIVDLGDLADPDVAAAFDGDGDGRADLIGCEPGWACGAIVDHHLEAFGLTDTVEQLRGDYGPRMEAAIERERAGEPVLFYAFTPHWSVGALVPGDEVAWLPVPFASLPDDLADQEDLIEVPSVVGCPADPCPLGFAPNDIRAVAARDLLDEQPAIEALLAGLEIPLADISAQNARMLAGEDSADDIAAAAATWVRENRDAVDTWLAAAIDAHVEAGLALSPPPADTGPVGPSVGELRVVTRLAPPFVTYDESLGYSGFALELLDLVADDVGAEIDLYAVNSTAKLIDDVERGEASVGAGAVAITSRREQGVDFSQPFFDSGLQILVAERDQGFLGGRIGSVVRAVFSRDLLVLVVFLIGILVVAAHVIWFTERRSNPEFPQEYGPGIWESLWWAAVTATTVGYGDKTPKGVAGRLFGLLWMFSGLFVLAYFTAGIATAFTLDELAHNIEGPADLRGRDVGVPADAASVGWLERQGIAAETFPTADDAYEALIDGEVEAVVHDAAILQHHVATDGSGGVRLTGLVFAERGFGFVFPHDADLVEPFNRSLLRLIEGGEYGELYERWFGALDEES